MPNADAANCRPLAGNPQEPAMPNAHANCRPLPPSPRETDMTTSRFHSATLARPIPGLIGPEADTYLGMLDLQGLAPATRYEYHRELTRLAEMYPELAVGGLTRPHLDRYLIHRARVQSNLSPSKLKVAGSIPAAPIPENRPRYADQSRPPTPASASIPVAAAKLVHSHRFARTATSGAAHVESELGRQPARRFVLSFLDVRRDALDVHTAPEVIERSFHRLSRDAFVPAVLGHPPARLHFVGSDSLDAVAGKAQLSAAEEAVVQPVPDRPRAKAVLAPLHVGRAGVTQRVRGVL